MTTTWHKVLTDILSAQTEIRRLSPQAPELGSLNPGATGPAIREAEARLGRQLPAGYREFLAYSNGSPRFFGGASLLGTAELGDASHQDLLDATFRGLMAPLLALAFPRLLWRARRELIPFGIDPTGAVLFAFNPGTPTSHHEYEVVLLIHGIGFRCNSFQSFLETILELSLGELDSARLASLAA